MSTEPVISPEQISTRQSDYAEQWISFLKRRNAILNLVWSVLLVVSVCLLVLALYFFQQQQLEQEKVVRLEAQLQSTNASVVDFQFKHDALQQQIKSLQEERRNLEQIAGQNDSQLDLTSKIVDTLKQQIATLELENTSNIEALEKARDLIRRQQLDAASTSEGLEAQLRKREAELSKQLQERSMAYNALASRNKENAQELDRLSSQLADKNNVVERLSRERDTARKDNMRTQQALGALQEDYDKLSRDFKAMVSPIGSSGGTNQTAPAKSTAPANTLDPIITPATPKKEAVPVSDVGPVKEGKADSKPNKEASAFDFDSISIDRP